MYDAIIVGARCAGSPTAMLLARKGYKVLVIDRMTFPSDIMSTHYIQTDGIKRLDSWGLLDELKKTNCPPIYETVLAMNGMEFTPPRDPSASVAYCPRRTVLDKILVDAAREAGAEVREGVSLQELTFDGDRVTGIIARAADGAEVREEARIVIGADGLHSRVARIVGAPAYNDYPSYTCAYYTYWADVGLERAEIHMGEEAGVLAFPTNDGLDCIAVGRPHEEFAAFRADIEGTYMRSLEAVAPLLAEKVKKGRRAEKWIGTADVPNFFRKPYGPGWALVGDAGYHRDPVTGLGISEAFRDAELLADALDEGFSGRAPVEDALSEYERKRNEAAAPMYEVTVGLASGNVPQGMLDGIEAMAKAQQAEREAAQR